ncbi:MAG: TolB family protein, partial [Aggregatilineales bacterium]
MKRYFTLFLFATILLMSLMGVLAQDATATPEPLLPTIDVNTTIITHTPLPATLPPPVSTSAPTVIPSLVDTLPDVSENERNLAEDGIVTANIVPPSGSELVEKFLYYDGIVNNSDGRTYKQIFMLSPGEDVNNAQQLTFDTVDSDGAIVSPDGEKIVFRSGTGSERGLYIRDIVDSDNSTLYRLTCHDVSASIRLGQYRWSPDSSKIAYILYSDDYELNVIPVDGTDCNTQTPNINTIYTTPLSNSIRSPRWAGNGQISYQSTSRPFYGSDTEYQRLSLINSSGGNPIIHMQIRGYTLSAEWLNGAELIYSSCSYVYTQNYCHVYHKDSSSTTRIRENDTFRALSPDANHSEILLGSGDLIDKSGNLIQSDSIYSSTLGIWAFVDTEDDTNGSDDGGSSGGEDTCEVTLVTQANVPGVTQMAYDMRAMVEMIDRNNPGAGLIIHDGPTWNARRMDYDATAGVNDPIFKPADNSATPVPIPWGTTIKVNSYIELPNGEIWYRLAGRITEEATRYENGQAITEQVQNDAWIAARGADDPAFHYIELTPGNTITYPCGDNPLPEISDNEEITFFYDREAAARYGIAQAYKTSTTIGYPDVIGKRASQRLNPNEQITLTLNNSTNQ